MLRPLRNPALEILQQTPAPITMHWTQRERPRAGVQRANSLQRTVTSGVLLCVATLAALLLGLGFTVTASENEPAPLPDASAVKITKLFEVPSYCEGVVFDADGVGYVSHGDTITRFTLDGKNEPWAKTGAPNGHKVLPNGEHLVCDASRHAVLRLDQQGKMLPAASDSCDGKPLRGPNDLTLDLDSKGFYFTDPGESSVDKPIGTVHYVDADGKTHLVASGLVFPNGIVLTPDGKRLIVAESFRNRVLEYPVLSPGKVGEMTVFADLPKKGPGQIENAPDGMCLDAAGRLFIAHYGMHSVQVLDSTGKLLVTYPGGNLTTSNVAFGGPKHDQLFVTGGLRAGESPGGVFRIDLGITGRKILQTKTAEATAAE